MSRNGLLTWLGRRWSRWQGAAGMSHVYVTMDDARQAAASGGSLACHHVRCDRSGDPRRARPLPRTGERWEDAECSANPVRPVTDDGDERGSEGCCLPGSVGNRSWPGRRAGIVPLPPRSSTRAAGQRRHDEQKALLSGLGRWAR